MRITVQMDNTDYSIIADAVLRSGLLSKVKGSAGKLSVATFKVLSKGKKDGTIVKLINNYSGNLTEKCNQFLSDMYVPVTVSGTSARCNGDIEITADIQKTKEDGHGCQTKKR